MAGQASQRLETGGTAVVVPGMPRWWRFAPAVLTVAAAVLLFGFIHLAALRENDIAQRHGVEQMGRGLEALRGGFVLLAQDYSYWREAFDNLVAVPDPAWADTNIGQWLHDEQGLAAALVVDGNDRVVYAAIDGQRVEADAAGLMSSDLAALIAVARDGAAQGQRTVSGYLFLDGRPALVAVGILHYDDESLARPRPDVLVLVRDLNDDVTARLGADLSVGGVVFDADPAAPGLAGLTLAGPTGAALGAIHWPPARPGDEFLARVYPPAIIAFACLAGLAGAARGRSRRAYAELQQALARQYDLNRSLTQSELARARVEDQLSRRVAAIEASVDGIGLVDASGRLTYLNEAFAGIYGYRDAAALTGASWVALYPAAERERFDKDVHARVRRDGSWRGEAVGRRADGAGFAQEVSLTAVEDGGMICVVRDITDRKAAEAERAALETQFYQAQKLEAVGRLAGGIAHDFNNILSTVRGYAGFLVDDLPAGSPLHGFAEMIVMAGERATHLVRQILAFSRRQEEEHQGVDLNAVIEETVGLLRVTVPARVTLRVRSTASPVVVMGDATRLSQVIMNLCVNALDAVGEAHGSIDLALDVIATNGGGDPAAANAEAARLSGAADGSARMWVGAVVRPGRCARLVVRDSGCGIERAVMEKMFEPFYTTKPAGSGTGLGLAAVHGIVVSHGGAIAIESKPGAGTAFEILLPLAEDPAAPGAAGR